MELVLSEVFHFRGGRSCSCGERSWIGRDKVILLDGRKTDGDGSYHGGFNGLDEDTVMMLRYARREEREGWGWMEAQR